MPTRIPSGLLDLGDDEDVAEHDGAVGDDLEEDELAPEDVEAGVQFNRHFRGVSKHVHDHV